MKESIKDLVEKYHAGLTSTEEESRLIQFFQREEDLAELEVYRSIFIQSEAWQSTEASEAFKARLLENFAELEKVKSKDLVIHRTWLTIAAGVLLLLTGFLLGKTSSGTNDVASNELIALQMEVQSLRTMMIVSLFEKPRASDRIKAVRMAEEMENPVAEAIEVLVKAINEDPNTNVRIASIKALAAFRDLPEVQNALLEAIGKQKSPIVQIELLRSFKAFTESKKEEVLLELLDKTELDQQVRDQIQQMLKSI